MDLGGDSWVAIPQILIVPTYNMQYYCSAWCANALKYVTIPYYATKSFFKVKATYHYAYLQAQDSTFSFPEVSIQILRVSADWILIWTVYNLQFGNTTWPTPIKCLDCLITSDCGHSFTHGVASYPGRKGKNGLVPFACTCARYPSKTWSSGYNQ